MTNKIFKQIIKEIKELFPFNNYINKEYEAEMWYIINSLERLIVLDKKYDPLDIGCGPMDKTAFFKLLGFNCSAVDDLNDPWHLQGNNINKILEFSKKNGINFYRQTQDDYRIPFNMKFDLITCFAVIEHLHESPKYLLNTIGEYLNEDGLLIITVPNSVALYKRLKVLIGHSNLPRIDLFYNNIGKWRGHIREYTLSELIYIINQNNFEVILSKNFEAMSFEKMPILLRIFYNFLVKIIPNSGSFHLVIARKPKNWQPKIDDLNDYISSLKKSIPEGALKTFQTQN